MNPNKRTVLVVAKAYPPVTGGVETYSEELVAAYCRAGVVPTVVTQTTGSRGWQRRRYGGVDVDVYNTGPGNQAVTGLRMAAAVTRLTAHHFDFFHATTWRAGLALGAAVRRRPRVISVHGREVMHHPRVLGPLMRASLASADVVVAVSTATRRLAMRALDGRRPDGSWIVAHNGLSFPAQASALARRPETSADRPLRLFTVARLVERKNVRGALDAVRALLDAGTHVEYKVAGAGPLREELETYARSQGLGDAVEFVGRVPDKALVDLYLWADVFLHPHLNFGSEREFEGFGIVIADAMSFGCTPIAGSGDGPADFVIDGETGYLVDGADVQAVASALRQLDGDRALMADLSARGRQVAMGMSWDEHAALVQHALRLEETSA